MVDQKSESCDTEENYLMSSIDISSVETQLEMDENGPSSSSFSSKRVRKAKNKGSGANKVDVRAKLERSRQSARECRARKKLRYQYLEDLVAKRENANMLLKKEVQQLSDVVEMLVSNQHSKDEIEKRFNDIH